MINRLIAENTIKTPFKGQPFFSINKKLLAFQIQNGIRIKNISREAKDIDVAVKDGIRNFQLASKRQWLYVLNKNSILEIHHIDYIKGIYEATTKKIANLHNIENYRQMNSALVLSTKNKTLKVISFADIIKNTEENLNIDCNSLRSLTDVKDKFQICCSIDGQKVLFSKSSTEGSGQTEFYEKIDKQKNYSKTLSIAYLSDILAMYKDRFIFHRNHSVNQKSIDIYDIQESKLIGKFEYEGKIKHTEIRQNILLLVTNVETKDYLYIYVLNSKPENSKPLIANRNIYQRNQGDNYQMFNMKMSQSVGYIEKKKGQEVSEETIREVSENTCSLLYILNKNKEKIQIVKVDHAKLLKTQFVEERLSSKMYSKKIINNQVVEAEKLEQERNRIHSNIQVKKSGRTLEDVQQRFVEELIQIKLKGVNKKFDQLERRIQNLEKHIKGIYDKIDTSLEKINRQEIKKNVESLFESLSPKFQKYFNEIFKQVSGVLDQGVNYYNLKLAKEADMHKDALAQIVTQTFKATEEIVQIGKKEQEISEKTEQNLKKLLEAKRKWTKSSQEFENKNREVPSPIIKSGQTEGKVFVRADLNHPTGKRQT